MTGSCGDKVMKLLIVLGVFGGVIAVEAADVKPLVRQLMEVRDELAGVPFAEVVEANAGKKLLPISRQAVVDRRIVDRVSAAAGRVMKTVADPDHVAHGQRRINEVSRYFEEALLAELNAVDGFSCDFPKTAEGKTQRSGYPDLRLVDEKSGRIVYLDPKLFQAKSRNSSLRTFYFTPKVETNKILDDAHHLLVGFSHAGKVDGVWRFTGWELVDLAGFKVRLKAEFQGSNRDIYRAENIVASGE